MYDLGRRPPGPVEYYLGPIPKEKVAKTNAYFHSLLGNEYEKVGHVHEERSEASDPRPPWVAIGNDYAGFVQSNTIVPRIGRAVSVNSDPINKLAAVEFETEDGELKTIDSIASIVMATGFSPFESLSFLPQDVLTTLEYTADDSFLPLVLDQGGSIRSEIPDLGFVGYYRGPYWGAMEMQARFLGKKWTQESEEPAIAELQRQNIRLLRQPSTQAWRGQFPMSDYVGLMESFAKDLGIERSELQDIEGPGPVIPARYIYHDQIHLSSNQSQGQKCNDSQITLNSLSFLGLDNAISAVNDSPETQNAIAMAIFRSLQGVWNFTKRGYIGEMAGTMTFYPRYPTDDAFDKEYICEEVASESAEAPQSPKQTIWRLSEAGGTSFPIGIYSMETAESEPGGRDPGYLKLLSTRNEKNGSIDQSLTVCFALDRPADSFLKRKEDQYKFWLDGVSILRWEISHTENSLDPDMSITHTVCTRV